MKYTRPFRRPKADAGLEAAIIAAGGVTKLARRLKISHAAIAVWKRCPPARVPAISKITGIPRYVIRPDLYENPRDIAA